MFGLGFGEMLIVGLVALIAIGPKRMPGVAKAVGRGIREFRAAMDDMKSTVYREVQQPMKEALDQKAELRETTSEYLDRILAQREKEREETKAKADEIYVGEAAGEPTQSPAADAPAKAADEATAKEGGDPAATAPHESPADEKKVGA